MVLGQVSQTPVVRNTDVHSQALLIVSLPFELPLRSLLIRLSDRQFMYVQLRGLVEKCYKR